MPELPLIPSNELIKELLSRYDHAVFGGIKCIDDKASPLYVSRWVGNTATCLGLINRVSWVMNHTHWEEAEEVNLEDY